MKKIFIICFSFAFLLSGCSLFYSLFFKDPEVIGIKKIGISKVGLSGVTFNIYLLVLNENNDEANILECDYKLYVNDTFIGKGNTKEKQILYANDTSEVVMPLEVKTSDLVGGALLIFKDVISGKELLYKVEGEVLGEANGIELKLPVSIKKKLVPEIY